jgi:hypothetical protein
LTRHDDETARGIVIPLAAIASVCLLLTCGVFLFSGPDDDPDAPVGLRVPTAAAPYVPPVPGPPSTDPTASAAPSTRPSARPTATKPAGRPPSALPTASRGATAAPPAVPPPPIPSTPPPPQPPPPVPPVTTRPPAADPARDVDVVAVASSSPWYTSGSVTITNDTPHTLNTWDLKLVSSGRANRFDMFIGDDMRMSTQGTTAIATGTRPLAPHASVTILFSLSGRVDAMGCTFSGVPCRVRGIG